MGVFATSHGKSPCDGIGGMVKWKLTQERLMRPSKKHHSTAMCVFQFCEESIDGITKFFYLAKTSFQYVHLLHKDFLLEIQSLAQDHFIISPQSLWEDSCLSAHHKTLHTVEHTVSLVTNFITCWFAIKVLCCLYIWQPMMDGLGWKADNSKGDVCITFIHPNGPSAFFYWPSHKDRCWVPLTL